MNKFISLIIASAIFFVGCGSVATTNVLQEQSKQVVKEEKYFKVKGYKIEKTKEQKFNNEKIKEDITNIIEEVCGSELIGVSFTDLTRNIYVGKNDNEEFLAASTIKLAYAMYICERLQDKTMSLDDVYTYTSADYDTGTGIMQGHRVGRQYTLKELMINMIVYSDNIATNMIIRRVGYANMKLEIGNMIGEYISTDSNIITSYQMNKFLELLYQKKDEEYYEFLMEILKETVFDDRFTKELNKEYIAHKIGNYLSYVNDVGVFFEYEPYTLSVYTDGVYNSEELISELSVKIHNYYKENIVNSSR